VSIREIKFPARFDHWKSLDSSKRNQLGNSNSGLPQISLVAMGQSKRLGSYDMLFCLIFIPVAPYLILVAASLSVGYWVGTKSRTSVSDSAPQKTKFHGGESEALESDGGLYAEECKMVKLNGKILAPSAHATKSGSYATKSGSCRTNRLGNVFRKDCRAVSIYVLAIVLTRTFQEELIIISKVLVSGQISFMY
jgi:hypothetical protein